MPTHRAAPHATARRPLLAGAPPGGPQPSPAGPEGPARVARTVATCSLLMDTTVGIISLAVPLAAVHLGAPPLTLGLLGAAHRAAVMVISPVAGAASDRWGRKRLVMTSITVLTAALVLMAGARSLAPFFALVAVAGAAIGLFWSPLQAWMGDAAAGDGSLARSIGRFNVAWSIGSFLGTAAAGALFAWHPAAPFLWGAAASVAIGLFLARLPDPSGGRPREPQPAARARNRAAGASPDAVAEEAVGPWLLAGRLAVFAPYFVIGAINNLFPKLADAEGYSAAAIGWLVACIGIARTGTFCALGSWTGWPYRTGILTGAFALAALGTAGLGFPLGSAWYGACFLLIGCAQGIGYASSLFYALDPPGPRGRRSGLHEFTINAGAAAGPLAVGALAQLWGLREAFLGAALLPLGLTFWMATRGKAARGQGVRQLVGKGI